MVLRRRGGGAGNDLPKMRGPRPGVLPLVLQRLLPQAAPAGTTITLSVVLRFVLPQTAPADSADTVPVVLR